MHAREKSVSMPYALLHIAMAYGHAEENGLDRSLNIPFLPEN
jgi:hypothetical protein